ncbi:hypothetical protein GCM10028895_55210 [Pontibacter rugosus]
MACHIYAASEGLNARRTNTDLSDEEVAGISNGIWMCYNHGKLIDTDDERFTPEMLFEWKQINERIASFRQETGYDYKTAYQSIKLSSLIENKILLPKGLDVNKRIGDAIHDSCLSQAWGVELTETIRDFLIEHVRNALLHGKATNAYLEINHSEVIIEDNGKDFDPRSLLVVDRKNGGTLSLKALLNKFSSKIFLSSQRIESTNRLKISIPSNREAVLNGTDCRVEIGFSELHTGNLEYELLPTCKEVFVVLPEFFVLSDIAFLSRKHPILTEEKRHIVFVIANVSQTVQELLKEQYPKCQILEVKN